VTIPVGKPNVATAPRRAVSDFDTRDRLGELRQHGELFHAYDRLGRSIGIYAHADVAIEAVRKAAGLDVP
jgi:hypothetical protein